MAKLKPRRGKAADAANIVLARGEVFFEYPSTGPGTGKGKIKMGDGTTKYSSLPDFIPYPNDIKIGFTNSTSPSNIDFDQGGINIDPTINAGYLDNIAPTSTLSTIFTNLKQLLVNFYYIIDDAVYCGGEEKICGPDFVLNTKSGELIIPSVLPSSPEAGSIWIS